MKTEMELTEVKNENVAKSLSAGIRMRAEAHRLEKESKKLKEDANVLLEPLLDSIGADKVKSDFGTVSLYTSTRSKFNLAGFKEELIRKGIDPGVIAVAESNNTETSTSAPTVKFTVRKEKI